MLEFKSLATKPKPGAPKPEGVAVDIWHNRDSILQSAQLYQLSAPDSFIVIKRYAVDNKTYTGVDTVQWNTNSSQTEISIVSLKRAFAKRLAKRFAETDSIRIVGKLNKRKQFIIERTTPMEPANLLLTTKFRKWEPITDINPQKQYNWYTAETISLYNTAEAYNNLTLYKPEDFDSSKKYPVIFYLSNKNLSLEKGSALYTPILSNGVLNISYFASHGYIILEIPSMIKTGTPGPSMLERIKEAIGIMRKYKWADTARFGIQGHGTSAYFVNYILTQTPVFRAAQESAGITDLISYFGNLDGKGASMQPILSARMACLEKRCGMILLFIFAGSPVIGADKIKTPLLMMHNKADMVTPFSQGVELFTGLRRLGKRCWMFYTMKKGIRFDKTTNQEDFTLRLQQFFDHYLKNKPAPVWMTKGIPAKMKGIERGFEMDTEISTPGEGLLTPERKQKWSVKKNYFPFLVLCALPSACSASRFTSKKARAVRLSSASYSSFNVSVSKDSTCERPSCIA